MALQSPSVVTSGKREASRPPLPADERGLPYRMTTVIFHQLILSYTLLSLYLFFSVSLSLPIHPSSSVQLYLFDLFCLFSIYVGIFILLPRYFQLLARSFETILINRSLRAFKKHFMVTSFEVVKLCMPVAVRENVCAEINDEMETELISTPSVG